MALYCTPSKANPVAFILTEILEGNSSTKILLAGKFKKQALKEISAVYYLMNTVSNQNKQENNKHIKKTYNLLSRRLGENLTSMALLLTLPFFFMHDKYYNKNNYLF
ncbi:MAG: hypothetical protein ACK46R_14680 [Bacteroidota bacterium]